MGYLQLFGYDDISLTRGLESSSTSFSDASSDTRYSESPIKQRDEISILPNPLQNIYIPGTRLDYAEVPIDKKTARAIKNREASIQSRKRKREQLLSAEDRVQKAEAKAEALQKQVTELLEINSVLTVEIERLRAEHTDTYTSIKRETESVNYMKEFVNEEFINDLWMPNIKSTGSLFSVITISF